MWRKKLILIAISDSTLHVFSILLQQMGRSLVKTNWTILCMLPGGKRFQPVGGRKRPEPKACLEPIYISHLTTKSKARLVPVPGYLNPGRSRAMISVP